MVGDALAGAVPVNCEPDKCAGWEWHRWDEELPTPLFGTLSEVRRCGFDPFDAATLAMLPQDAHGGFPPYCCCILHEAGTGALLLEERDAAATVAASQLTCFGGKREDEEEPLECIRRELREELGIETTSAASAASEAASLSKRPRSSTIAVGGLKRAVDLFVDGALIAWFYSAPAPPRDVRRHPASCPVCNRSCALRIRLPRRRPGTAAHGHPQHPTRREGTVGRHTASQP